MKFDVVTNTMIILNSQQVNEQFNTGLFKFLNNCPEYGLVICKFYIFTNTYYPTNGFNEVSVVCQSPLRTLQSGRF